MNLTILTAQDSKRVFIFKENGKQKPYSKYKEIIIEFKIPFLYLLQLFKLNQVD